MEEVAQIIVPQSHWLNLLWLAHTNPLGGHLGRKKTIARLTCWLFWPHLYRDVE